jgi:hypothetical protein
MAKQTEIKIDFSETPVVLYCEAHNTFYQFYPKQLKVRSIEYYKNEIKRRNFSAKTIDSLRDDWKWLVASYSYKRIK